MDIKFDKTFFKLAAICAAGMILNIIGVAVTKHFNLSIFLDSIGTIFIAALGGYVPGISRWPADTFRASRSDFLQIYAACTLTRKKFFMAWSAF